jgi:AcrR family transcriptional regulator
MKRDERSEDLRVRRTRTLLEQAFRELMAQKSFQAITVQDITGRAMVNRSTFYDHFVDKYALLEHSVTEMFRNTLAAQLPEAQRYSTENLEGLILTMCGFFDHLHGHCRAADEQNIALFESQVMRQVQEVLRGWLPESQAGAADGGPGAAGLAVAVASWAIYGAAQHWSTGRREGSAAAYAASVAPRIEACLGLTLAPV